MSIQLSSNFQENSQLPLDARTVQADITARDAIPVNQRFEGLMVFLLSTAETWQLQGGITNSDWVLFGGGTSTNIYNSNGVLTNNRFLTGGGHSLTLGTVGSPLGGDGNGGLNVTSDELFTIVVNDSSQQGAGFNVTAGDAQFNVNHRQGASSGDINFSASDGGSNVAGMQFNQDGSAQLNLTKELTINSDPGVEGKVLTTHGVGLPPTWEVAGGGVPALTDDHIAFGDEGDLMTSSNDFTFDPDGDNTGVRQGNFYVSSYNGFVFIANDNDSLGVGFQMLAGTTELNINYNADLNMTAGGVNLISLLQDGTIHFGVLAGEWVIDANNNLITNGVTASGAISALGFGYAGTGGQIAVTGFGSQANGYSVNSGIIQTNGLGARAFGSTDGGTIYGNADGSQAFGFAQNNGSITSDGQASLVFGVTNGGQINTAAAVGLVFGTVDDTGHIYNGGVNSLAFGNAISGAFIDADINNSMAFGFAQGDSFIQASGNSSQVFGYTQDGFLQTNAIGSQVFGKSAGGTITNDTSAIGSLTFGSVDANVLSKIISNGVGAQAFGNATNGGLINGGGYGSIAFGTSDGTDSTIQTFSSASLAFGGTETGGVISANGDNSQAFGFSGGGHITTVGQASLVFGSVDDNADSKISTDGLSTLAFGSAALGGTIIALGDSSHAFGIASGELSTISAQSNSSMAFGHVTAQGVIETISGANTMSFGEATGVAFTFTLDDTGNPFVVGDTIDDTSSGAQGTIQQLYQYTSSTGVAIISVTINEFPFTPGDSLSVTASGATGIVSALYTARITSSFDSLAHGQTYGGGLVKAYGQSHAFGYAEIEGHVEAFNQSFAFGAMQGTAGGIIAGGMGGGIGTFAGGFALDDDTLGLGARIEALADASFAFGKAQGGNSAITAQDIGAMAIGFSTGAASINAVGGGSFARGRSDEGSIIASNGVGSMASGYAAGGGQINVTGSGAHAFGFATVSGDITTNGQGAFAGGYGETGTVNATGKAAFSWGDGVTASNDYTYAFGRNFSAVNDETFNIGFGQLDFQVQSGTVLIPYLGGGGNQLVAVDNSGFLFATTVIPYIDNVAVINATANISATNLNTPNTPAVYRVSYVLLTSANDITAGAVSATFAWTDNAGSTSITSSSVLLTTLGRTQGSFIAQLTTPFITYATTHTGIFGTAEYDLYITVEQLQ